MLFPLTCTWSQSYNCPGATGKISIYSLIEIHFGTKSKGRQKDCVLCRLNNFVAATSTDPPTSNHAKKSIASDVICSALNRLHHTSDGNDGQPTGPWLLGSTSPGFAEVLSHLVNCATTSASVRIVKQQSFALKLHKVSAPSLPADYALYIGAACRMESNVFGVIR